MLLNFSHGDFRQSSSLCRLGLEADVARSHGSDETTARSPRTSCIAT